MIEMSIEKETVLTGDGTGTLSRRGKTPSPPINIGAPFMANMVLAELRAPPEVEAEVAEAVRVRGDGKPLTMKNGLQPIPQPQSGPLQQQQSAQKLGKRRYSMSAGFKHPGFSKRRRRANSDCEPVLPTNFLLGGNIFDPLNLNSLLDEEVNKALNAETPKSSPLPAKSREPVEILIPKDITDPLNLSGRGGDAHGGVLVSPMKIGGGRRRHRNRHHGSVQLDAADLERSKGDEAIRALFPVSRIGEAQVSDVPEVTREGATLLDLQPVEESPRPYELNTSINCRDEVVPPILPRRRSNTSTNSAPGGTSNFTSSTHPSKNRKRRRTTSRSERLSITPTPTSKQCCAEKGRSQTSFHTPIVSGAIGMHRPGARQALQNWHKPQRKFQYGTYSHYYGYQTPAQSRDPRLAALRPEWFRGKKVLDIGCNVGHLTVAIAKHWSPAHILGLDIDGRLVHTARQNLRHFLSELQRQDVQRGCVGHGEARGDKLQEKERTESTERHKNTREMPEDDSKRKAGEGQVGGQGSELIPLMKLQLELLRPFPVSFRLCRGPIAAPPLQPHIPGLFPNNVSFMKGNYVPESEAGVMSQRAEYDVILCLSVTKWVHLNWGDLGLQWLFKRAYRHLTPGGVFILEAQPWSSYSKRKRLTETTFRNYNSIRLRPDQFSTYLTSEVGFTSYELISTPNSCPKGLQRPIYLFHKGPASSRK